VSVVSLKNLIEVWNSLGQGTSGADKVKVGQVAALLNLEGHTNGVRAIAFSHDGKRIAVTGDDVTKVYDSKAGRLTLTLKGHLDTVLEVTFHPKDQLIATYGSDKTIRLWDATKGNQIHIIKDFGERTICRLTFSTDGHQMMYNNHPNGGSTKSARFWTIGREK